MNKLLSCLQSYNITVTVVFIMMSVNIDTNYNN